MSQVHMAEQELPDFGLRIRQEGRQVVLQCSGSFEAEACVIEMEPELLRLHERLLSARPVLVRLEIQDVDYLSSSALRMFACWFLKVAEAGDAGYAVLVTYDPEREWQARSLKALQRLAPGRIGLEPIYRPTLHALGGG